MYCCWASALERALDAWELPRVCLGTSLVILLRDAEAMWKNLDNCLFRLVTTLSFAVRLTPGARPGACIVNCLLAAQVLGVAIVHAQPVQGPTVTVLIETSFQGRATRFLEELHSALAPQIRETVRFDTRVAPTSMISKLLQEKWDMAILSSTFALTDAQTSAAAAFEMPFIFASMRNVIALQQSPVGRAGLSAMSQKGMTGLVYLNGGVTRVTGRGEPKSPDDLKGKKVAVSSPAQMEILQTMGAVPLTVEPVQAPEALRSGAVDSVLINSGNPDSWVFPERGFLLADSVKAQVALVVTQDASWDRIPFVYRARIGDAAIAASQRFDQALIEAEGSLLSRARSSGVSLINFRPDDTSRATRQWINEQPEALRDTYFSVYKYLNPSGPRDPVVPRRGGQVGKLYFATTRDDTGDSNFLYRFGDSRTGIVKCGQIEFLWPIRAAPQPPLLDP